MEITYDQIDGIELEITVLSSSSNVGLEKLRQKSIVISNKLITTGRVESIIKVYVDDNHVCSTHDMHKALRVYNQQ